MNKQSEDDSNNIEGMEELMGDLSEIIAGRIEDFVRDYRTMRDPIVSIDGRQPSGIGINVDYGEGPGQDYDFVKLFKDFHDAGEDGAALKAVKSLRELADWAEQTYAD